MPSVVRLSDLRALAANDRLPPAAVERSIPDRSYGSRQHVVNITYSVRPPAAVAPPVARPDGGAEFEAMGEQMAGTSARIGVAAADAAAARPTLSRAELRAAADRGEVLTQAQMEETARIAALARLLRVLPIGAIASVCNTSVDDLSAMDADRLAHHFVTRGKRALWSVGTINDCHNVWVRFMVWLERHDVVHDGMSFMAPDVGDFLEEVDSRARAKGLTNKARAEADDAKAAWRAAEGGHIAPPKRKWQDGSQAANGVASKLRSMRKQFALDIPIEDATANRQPGIRPSQPTPALPIGVVFRLYEHVRDVAEKVAQAGGIQEFNLAPGGFSTVATAHVAAALLFAAFSCNRMEQVNDCVFLGEVEGFLHGALLLDKHPDPAKRRARPFWMQIAGPDGGRQWFDFLKLTLQGAEGGCFVFRDFECSRLTDTDPGHAVRWLNNPLRGARLVGAIASVIHRVCGVPLVDAARFSKHSARHFLMEVAGHRNVHPLRLVEIGRWSGSTAQDPDLTPSQRLDKRHQLAAGVMPDNYAPLSKVRRVCRILGDQLAALGNLWRTHTALPTGIGGIPVFGGFSVMGAWPAEPSER